MPSPELNLSILAVCEAAIGVSNMDLVLEGILKKRAGIPITGYQLWKMIGSHLGYWIQFLIILGFIRNEYGMEDAQLFGLLPIIAICVFMFVRARAVGLKL